MHERSLADNSYSELLLYLLLLICAGLYTFGVVTSPTSGYFFDFLGYSLAFYPLIHVALVRNLLNLKNFFKLFNQPTPKQDPPTTLLDRLNNLIKLLAHHYHFFAFVTFATLLATTLDLHKIAAFSIVYFAIALFGAYSDRKITAGLVFWFLFLIWGRALTFHYIYTKNNFFKQLDLFSVGYLAPKTIAAIAFGALGSIIYGLEIHERRMRHKRVVDDEIDGLLKKAENFRLTSTRRENAATNRKLVEKLLTVNSASAICDSNFVTLALAKRALNAHTCVLLCFTTNKALLHIMELASDSDDCQTKPFRAEKGFLGSVYRNRTTLNYSNLKNNQQFSITYYTKPQDISSFIAVPLLENGSLYGILCADRIEKTPFSRNDEILLENCADMLLRSQENERLFLTIEKSKSELSHLFVTSERLNTTLTPEQVYQVAVESIADILDYDFCAITTYDAQNDLHKIVYIDDKLDLNIHIDWLDVEFKTNRELVSMAIVNKHPYPYGGVVRHHPAFLFTPELPIPDINSLQVQPLISHGEPIGTLSVASKQANLFDDEHRTMISFFASQIATSLQNANLYKKMELMATTDGLTGLANHRTFQQRLDETIARADRQGTTFSLLLTDIDKFKLVNDTYGHPVGDQVIKTLANTFKETLRKSDIPARYGGEEFTVILEDTDTEGALTIANRLREAFKKCSYDTPQGTFSRTISIGVATWPTHAQEKQLLIDRADQALYWSKEHGRDQVTDYGSLPADAPSEKH